MWTLGHPLDLLWEGFSNWLHLVFQRLVLCFLLQLGNVCYDHRNNQVQLRNENQPFIILFCSPGWQIRREWGQREEASWTLWLQVVPICLTPSRDPRTQTPRGSSQRLWERIWWDGWRSCSPIQSGWCRRRKWRQRGGWGKREPLRAISWSLSKTSTRSCPLDRVLFMEVWGVKNETKDLFNKVST